MFTFSSPVFPYTAHPRSPCLGEQQVRQLSQNNEKQSFFLQQAVFFHLQHLCLQIILGIFCIESVLGNRKYYPSPHLFLVTVPKIGRVLQSVHHLSNIYFRAINCRCFFTVTQSAWLEHKKNEIFSYFRHLL